MYQVGELLQNFGISAKLYNLGRELTTKRLQQSFASRGTIWHKLGKSSFVILYLTVPLCLLKILISLLLNYNLSKMCYSLERDLIIVLMTEYSKVT